LGSDDVQRWELGSDGDARSVVSREDRDGVVPIGAVDDDGIGLAVAAAPSALEVQVEVEKAGCGCLVDRDGIGTAQGVVIDLLNIVEVHGDIADITSESDSIAVSRDIDVLRCIRAVEFQRVIAALSYDGVAAVAVIPPEGVVPGAEESDVI